MDTKISLRLSPDATEYLSTLQRDTGRSLSEVVRDLIEQSKPRSQVSQMETAAELDRKLDLIYELCRYTASLVTSLARETLEDSDTVNELIDKAIADAGEDRTPANAGKTEED